MAHRGELNSGDVEKEFWRSRRVSKIGMAVMDVTFCCHVAILVTVVIAVAEPTALGSIAVGEKALLVSDILSVTLAMLALIRFVRGVAKGTEPFGSVQCRRLMIAALLIAAHVVLDYIAPAFDEVVVRLPLGELSLHGSTGGSVINITSVSLVVFLFVLAGTIRYANALKRDSDSIL